LRLKKKNKLEKSQQDDSAPSAPQTQQTMAPNTAEIQEYLLRNVKAIPLLELFHRDDYMYAPLILDGSSSVGKMQQAFALLKNNSEMCQLIYLNLASVVTMLEFQQQPIHQETCKLTDQEAIEKATPIAMEQVKTYTDSYENDSMDCFLESPIRRRQVNVMFFQNQKLDGLKALVEKLQKSKLEYKNGAISKVTVKVKLTSMTTDQIFDKVVLFIDEALPQGANNEGHLNLCLLVNLACAMCMQVVLMANAVAAAG